MPDNARMNPSPTSLLRRHWLWGLGAAAAAAGAGVAWWRLQPGEALPQAVQSFWQQRFEPPGGGVLDMAAFRGKPLLVNFWATWCPPCKEELPSLQTLHDIGGGDLMVIGINVRETATRVRRYVESTGLGFPVVLDPQAEMAKRYGVTAFPTTLLIAPDGRVRWRVLGEVDWSGAEAGRWIAELSASAGAAPSRR